MSTITADRYRTIALEQTLKRRVINYVWFYWLQYTSWSVDYKAVEIEFNWSEFHKSVTDFGLE